VPYLSEDKIAAIVDRVVSRLGSGDIQLPARPDVTGPTAAAPSARVALSEARAGRGVFTDLDAAVARRGRLCALQHSGSESASCDRRRNAARSPSPRRDHFAYGSRGDRLGRFDQKVLRIGWSSTRRRGPRF